MELVPTTHGLAALSISREGPGVVLLIERRAYEVRCAAPTWVIAGGSASALESLTPPEERDRLAQLGAVVVEARAGHDVVAEDPETFELGVAWALEVGRGGRPG